MISRSGSFSAAMGKHLVYVLIRIALLLIIQLPAHGRMAQLSKNVGIVSISLVLVWLTVYWSTLITFGFLDSSARTKRPYQELANVDFFLRTHSAAHRLGVLDRGWR